MEHFQSVLLNVWREACRHIRMSESIATMAPMLLRDMPLAQVLVRRLDPAQGTVETVGVGIPGAVGSLSPSQPWSSERDSRRWQTWIRRGEVTRHTAGTVPRSFPPSLLPDDVDTDVLLVPLRPEVGQPGALLLVARAGTHFNERHKALADVLKSPLASALDNDHRVHEMEILREATEADNRSLLRRLGRNRLADPVVGAESGLRAVMERVSLVAKSDVPVLILGETGAGKELIARAIHERSSRAAGAFIRVNCGAIPPELVDAQLFGHERGAFTGAVERRRGWFEQADGGTLLLDEIGELPLPAQVRLLRILQDGWLDRVGGHEPVHVDVRMIAATHRDLAEMARQGRFREDLWYRIAVFPILLPPLRERLEDLPALARHLAERAAMRFGLCAAYPSDDDLRLLRSYAWPGNIRELATVIDRAAILGNGERLDVAKALGLSRESMSREPAPEQAAPAADPAADTLSLDAAIRRHIETVLTATRGRVEGPYGAAVKLCINPNTLRARMRKLGIDRRRFTGR